MGMWTELLSSDREGLLALGREMNVHPLALEDCLHLDQRPKLEDFENHQLLVWFMLAKGKVYEINFLIFPSRLILVSHEPQPELSSWKEFLRLSENPRDVWHLLYQALDGATDTTWSEVRGLLTKVDEFEQDMFRLNSDPQSLLKMKKKLNLVEYSIGHLASVAKQLQNYHRPKDDLQWKLRDLHDHCERINRSLELYRGQISSSIELYWGHQANRTNAQIKKLSLLASVAVPLTFWASFWGMNFQFIPYHSPELFFLAILVMAISVALVFWMLLKKGYWSD